MDWHIFYNYWPQFGLLSTYFLFGIDLQGNSLLFASLIYSVHLVVTCFPGQPSTHKNFQVLELTFCYQITDTFTQETYFKCNVLS